MVSSVWPKDEIWFLRECPSHFKRSLLPAPYHGLLDLFQFDVCLFAHTVTLRRRYNRSSSKFGWIFHFTGEVRLTVVYVGPGRRALELVRP